MVAEVALEGLLTARRKEYGREWRTAIAYGLLMLAVTLLGKWPLLRAVTAALAGLRGLAAYMILRHQRALQDIASATEDSAQVRLERVVARDSAFVKSVVYWYALPLSVGLVGIAVAIWNHARSIPMVVVCLALAVGTIVGTVRLNAVKLAEMESMPGGVEASERSR